MNIKVLQYKLHKLGPPKHLVKLCSGKNSFSQTQHQLKLQYEHLTLQDPPFFMIKALHQGQDLSPSLVDLFASSKNSDLEHLPK